MEGFFGSQGELFFEINLIAADRSIITVDAIFDTGFTDWLALNIQDIEELKWSFLRKQQKQTASGQQEFSIYQGTVSFDGQEQVVPVVGGEELTDILMGLKWLDNRRLLVDKKSRLLTLELL